MKTKSIADRICSQTRNKPDLKGITEDAGVECIIGLKQIITY